MAEETEELKVLLQEQSEEKLRLAQQRSDLTCRGCVCCHWVILLYLKVHEENPNSPYLY